MKVLTLINKFVEKVNATPACFPDYVTDVFNDQTPADGRIAREGEAFRGRVQSLEEKLSRRLPNSFRMLLAHYSFPPLEVEGITFFAWRDDSKDRSGDLLQLLFEPNSLAPMLLNHGFLQIGRPDSGLYDGVCFDTHRKVGHNEYAIVLIEHEQLLQFDKIKIIEEIAPSFHELMRRFVEK